MADIPDLPATEIAIVEQTNAFRKGQDLSQLKRNPALDEAARLFARYLAKSGRFAHEADGRQPAERAAAAGYGYCAVAENLALNLDSRGFTVKRLASEVIEGWKSSEGHRKNMLMPHMTDIGVGIAQAPGADPKFLSVQLFGRPKDLAYSFSISNKSHDSATYSFGGTSHAIEPLQTTKHTACNPGAVVFDRVGSWLTGRRLDSSFETSDGAHFYIRPTTGGRIEVEMQR